MRKSFSFAYGAFVAVAAIVVAAGCQSAALQHALPMDAALALRAAVYPTPPPTPSARLYVDHNGTIFIYKLPLTLKSKPEQVLAQSPGSTSTAVAVDGLGEIAVGTPSELRLFGGPKKHVTTLSPTKAWLRIPLTPAITSIGINGAAIADLEFDPTNNLWLVSAGGVPEVTELQRPFTKQATAVSTVIFGASGTKAAGFSAVSQARFDISSALYVYAGNNNVPPPQGQQLFKSSFPYVKPVTSTGLDLEQADFVDSSQYLISNPYPIPMILGQYFGPLHSPPPQAPPPPPVDELAQFQNPINVVQGPYPVATVNVVVGGLIADPPRMKIYTLRASDGQLQVWPIPLVNNGLPKISLRCPGTKTLCLTGSEKLFLGP